MPRAEERGKFILASEYGLGRTERTVGSGGLGRGGGAKKKIYEDPASMNRIKARDTPDAKPFFQFLKVNKITLEMNISRFCMH